MQQKTTEHLYVNGSSIDQLVSVHMSHHGGGVRKGGMGRGRVGAGEG